MIDQDRITERLEAIYACGKQEDGTYSRIAFSLEDKAGRDLFAGYLNRLGMKTYYDKAGNMIARREGTEPGRAPIMMGSHLDTVPDGGKYDGAFGCVGALEVIEELTQQKEQLRHPLEIIVFADEEGVRFGKGLSGSNAISGLPLIGFLAEDTDATGKSRGGVMKIYGVDVDSMGEAARRREDVACFLEMHVEQGRNLEKHEKQIGIVTAIAGVSRYVITVRGETNHSGSTMMEDRKDALVGAADLIHRIPQIVREKGSSFAVGTVGKVTVLPGAMNVIPGEVSFTLEVREQTDEKRKEITEEIFRQMDSICEENGLQYEKKDVADYPCAPMDPHIVGTMEEICERQKAAYCKLPSGAFHDAMFMTRTFPTGMLFVPSRDGISHSPLEYTAPEDLAAGCRILYETVKELDLRLD